MTVLFSSLVLLDGWFDGSLTVSSADDKQVQGTMLTLLVAGIISLGGSSWPDWQPPRAW